MLFYSSLCSFIFANIVVVVVVLCVLQYGQPYYFNMIALKLTESDILMCTSSAIVFDRCKHDANDVD